MANGLLSGGLPPGLAGFEAGRQGALQQQLGILALQNAQQEAMLNPLKLAQLELAVKKARRNAALVEQLTGTSASAPQQALTQGAAIGDVGPTMTNAARIPQQGGLLGIQPQTQAMLLSGDQGLMALAKAQLEQSKPVVGREGAPVLERNPDGSFRVAFSAPKSQPGIQLNYGQQGVTASGIPGYSQAAAQLAGSERAATEAAAAPYQPPIETRDAQGRPVYTPRPVAAAPYLQQGVSPGGGSPLLPPVDIPRGATTGPTPGEVAFSETSSREMGKLASELTANAQKAESQLANIDALRVAVSEIKKAGGSTNAYAPMVQRATELVQGMGIPPASLGLPKDAGPYQVLDALANKMALGLIGVPGGMPANLFSEADRKFVQASVVQKTDTERGFNAKLDLFDKIQRRAMEQEQSWIQAQEQGKSFSQWRTQWAKHVNENPLFPKTDVGSVIRETSPSSRSRESILRQYGIGR